MIVDYSALESFDSHLSLFNKNQLFVLCFSSNLEVQSKKLNILLKEKGYNIKLLRIKDGEKEKEITLKDELEKINSNLGMLS